MIQFEDSEHIVVIEDGLAEDIIKIAKWWKEEFRQDIEKHVIDEVISQMRDDSNHINFYFDPDEDTVRALGFFSSRLSLSVAKKSVTIRNKRKKVRIKEGSLYEGLNDNPEFIEALTEEYNTNSGSYVYYLPVIYKAHLVGKDESTDSFMDLHVDIPFSDIEFY